MIRKSTLSVLIRSFGSCPGLGSLAEARDRHAATKTQLALHHWLRRGFRESVVIRSDVLN